MIGRLKVSCASISTAAGPTSLSTAISATSMRSAVRRARATSSSWAFASTSTCAIRQAAQGGGYPARHGGMMTVADLVGTMGGGTLVGLRKFLPTVSMTFDFVAPAKVGDWVEGRAEVV